MKLQIELSKNLKAKPATDEKLVFGTRFTDHMFVMEYTDGEWRNPRITPYAPFSLDPSTSVFHYGQACFEGMKAYRNKKGEIRLFRPNVNLARMNESNERICIPQFDEKFVLKALVELIKIDEAWIPDRAGESLYIRPCIIAADTGLGVHAAKNYLMFIILSPAGPYFPNGLAPVDLFVEQHFVRAAKGGTGRNKVIGNYAASLLAAKNAKEKFNCDQVMWLDAKENKYVEEVGAMNIFFVIDGKIVTPELSGSILPGVTRRSVIELLSSMGYTVEERLIAIDEVVKLAEAGSLTEIFGTGTAAVIAPVGKFIYGGKTYPVADGAKGKIAALVYETLTGIQTGEKKDPFGWVYRIK